VSKWHNRRKQSGAACAAPSQVKSSGRGPPLYIESQKRHSNAAKDAALEWGTVSL
jgi:hypothetical protein